jgi:hypothetical protein
VPRHAGNEFTDVGVCGGMWGKLNFHRAILHHGIAHVMAQTRTFYQFWGNAESVAARCHLLCICWICFPGSAPRQEFEDRKHFQSFKRRRGAERLLLSQEKFAGFLRQPERSNRYIG